jgi:hypothetical protein
MNDLEVLKNGHRRCLNETLEEHDMQMDSGLPRNVLAALHRENEWENSAMLPTTTSRSSSNGGRVNAAKATRRAEAAAREARRAGVRAASTSPTPPQDNLPPRQASIFPALIPTLLPALDGDAICATAAPFLRDWASEMTGCDWARVSLCLACGEGPSLVKCQMEGCARILHHMCQTEWDSAEEGLEAHGSKKLCAYHHPSLANRRPSCSTSASQKDAAPSGAVPWYDAAKYPGVAAIATAMNDAMACWTTMPGPVEWCGASFEEMRHGVCLQMVVNGVHLQHKSGAKGLAWKDFYERTVGSRTG